MYFTSVNFPAQGYQIRAIYPIQNFYRREVSYNNEVAITDPVLPSFRHSCGKHCHALVTVMQAGTLAVLAHF